MLLRAFVYPRRVALDPALLALTHFEDAEMPRPKCPRCYDARMRFDDPHEVQDVESRRVRDHPGWDPDWIFGSFSASATCRDDDCGQVVLCVGTYRVDSARKFSEHQYSTWYSLEYASPPFVLMRVPESAPEEI